MVTNEAFLFVHGAARPVLSPDTSLIGAILPLDGEARWFPVSRYRDGNVSHIAGLQSFVDT